MVIMGLIIGAIFAFEISAGRLTARTSRSYQAQTRAAGALRTIATEMKEGVGVTVAQTNLVEYTVPKKETGSDLFKVPLEVGHRVRYYLGDKAGNAQTGGTYLWRGDDSSGSMGPTDMLADQVQSFSLQYQYPQYSTQPDAVVVTVAVQVTARGKTTVETHSTTVKLRNYGNLGAS